ncbi:GNAT family N-acetyltransferase [Streptomyces mangrovisoli]|uniref:GNAT family N-acetyltransferase n=1 Tax=Streptomyces mangrovisoli TaxID=1428628 RepID=A0A1J4P4W7_9ACTN|nr:GNAT family N-acetyltransferase [Streptomyces mangrovisoli]
MEEAVASCAALLRTVVDRDWTGPRAGRLEWSCRQAVEHIASDLIAYAGQLAGRPQDHYVPFEITFDEGTDNAGAVSVVEATGTLLAAAVRTTPRAVRAFHPYPYRSANRDGFAAMGVAEVLLHTHDVAEGLGLAYEAPERLADAVLATLFPHVQPGPDAWPTLLWATGRGDLPGRAPVTEWRWRNNIVLPAGRLRLEGVTPAAARELRAGGDGGFDWAEPGPFEGTRDAAGMVVKAYEAGAHQEEWGMFVLVRTEDDRAVGAIGFHGAPDASGCAEVGYDLAVSARGRGYATEALSALAEWALLRPGLRTLLATIERDNVPSQRVVSRVGFVLTGADGDELRYELGG